MKTYPYTADDGIIELIRKTELDNALELLREIRDNEVNPQDEADKFLRDHQPSELSKLRADNVEILERLRERTESHLAASSRDVQTIQQQSVLLDRLATALNDLASLGSLELPHKRDTALLSAVVALAAYKSAKPGNLPDPLAEAVKRMEGVPISQLIEAYCEGPGTGGIGEACCQVRARLIQAAKGEQP